MNYKVVPIPAEVPANVRSRMKSPQYGHPAFAETATGYGPCRQCLKTFIAGKEDRILFTYNSFENLSKLPLPGPIFIHKNECRSFSEDGFPSDLVDLPLLFEGFAAGSELISRTQMFKCSVDSQISEIFNSQQIKYINIRNAEAGCFVARIDRIP